MKRPSQTMTRFGGEASAGFVLWRLLICALTVLTMDGSVHAGESAHKQPSEFVFHHDHILGTSFDLIVCVDDSSSAVRAEKTALQEIERLRKILSTYDPASEISRFNSSRDPLSCSPELWEVLQAYDMWTIRSGGAYNPQVGELALIWRHAEKTGSLPPKSTLASVVRAISGSGWMFDACSRTVTHSVSQPLNVDSLGKGYIIQKAVEAVRTEVPTLTGMLLNIGGDIFASGARADSKFWPIGITDPNNSEDNAAPFAHVALRNRAISTSGAYERGYNVAGHRYSHILDPRTGMPADGVASATVVASDSATANALATTLCVLTPEEGLALIKSVPDAECLIISKTGEQFRSRQFVALEIPATGEAKKANEAKPSLWPKEFHVTLTVTLKEPPGGGRGYRRPYVAIWVNDGNGKRVRTVTVWGNQERYFPDLHEWSYGEKDRLEWAASLARATRPAGRYRLSWDGRDDSGNPLPPGTYTVFIEANREHGTYAKASGKITCEAATAQGIIAGTSEFAEARIEYGPASAQ